MEQHVVSGWTPLVGVDGAPPPPLALDFKEPGEGGKHYSFSVQYVGSTSMEP